MLLSLQKSRGVPIKMVVTSHEHITQVSEKKQYAEAQDLSEIKALMKDYTRDLPLDRLEKQYAMAFLNESLVSSAGQFFFKSDCGPH